MGLGLDENVLKSALKEMASSLVAAIDIGRVILIEPLQAAAEMPLWRLYVEVIVMGHEAIGMNNDPPALMGLCELLQEDVAIFIMEEHILSGHTA